MINPATAPGYLCLKCYRSTGELLSGDYYFSWDRCWFRLGTDLPPGFMPGFLCLYFALLKRRTKLKVTPR